MFRSFYHLNMFVHFWLRMYCIYTLRTALSAIPLVSDRCGVDVQ